MPTADPFVVRPRLQHPGDLILAGMGRAHFMLGDNDAAIEWLLKSLEQNPAFAQTYAYLAMAYVLKGEDGKAHAAAAEVRRLAPNHKLSELEPASSHLPRTRHSMKTNLFRRGARQGCRSRRVVASQGTDRHEPGTEAPRFVNSAAHSK